MPELKLDIGCGHNKQAGFYGIDLRKLPEVDQVVDLEAFPWPFDDESADEIFCSHYIEHTPDLIKFVDELYRIMKTGAKATIVAPYYSSVRAWQDPTHKRAISEFTFMYFNKQWRDANKLEHYGIKSDFDFTYGYMVDPAWQNRSEEARNFAIRFYINTVSDIQVVMTKRVEAELRP